MKEHREDQFAAALAHQLKAPVAALQAASANMRRNLRGILEDLSAMAGAGGADGVTARFIARVIDEPPPVPMTGLLPQDRLAVIRGRLREVGLEGDLDAAASSLLRGGWDTYMDEIAPLLGNERALALEILESAARIRSNLAALEGSIGRIRELASTMRLIGSPGGVEGDLCRGIERAAAFASRSLPEGVDLRLDLDRLPACSTRIDLLREVWANLIGNAVEAVGAAGSIRIEGGVVRGGGPARLAVRVIDDGPGIPAHVLPRVFDPFFSTRAASGGSGLGLALARRIVESLGGSIAVESRPGRTCFEVTLPDRAAAAMGEI